VHTHTHRDSEQRCDLLWRLNHGAGVYEHINIHTDGTWETRGMIRVAQHAVTNKPCKCKIFVKNLGYLQSIVCLVGCGLVSCDATLVAEFLDMNHGHQVVGANSWILQSTCCSINILVAGVLQAMGQEMFALEGDFHATQEVLPLEAIKCVTRFFSTWLIHALVNPNLHVDSARLEEGVIVL